MELTDEQKLEKSREWEKELKRLNRVVEPLKATFYHDRSWSYVFTAYWECNISFDVKEIASIGSDDILKQQVINRTIAELRRQIEHLNSLR